ncbi:MAG: tRNA pseudouridine(55) synthase TruB [Anaerolinea sp.]|nr:tRNA pseudouridine(55) synthase TruB [Anaerolinea sp.]
MSQIEGVLNVDKPLGMTSHDVVNQVRRISGLRRVGHAGTLDPLATGVLLLCLGRATRLADYLLGQTKSYAAAIRLGQTTTTYDAEGEVVQERPFTHLTLPTILETLHLFRGTVQQLPPMYSAVKKNGQPLYKLARQGVEVERPLRTITIYQLDVQQWQPPHLHITLTCSSGTYVRSLAHDLGEALGCGGYVASLQRTQVGAFTLDKAIPLADLSAAMLAEHLWPTDTAVAHFPRLDVSTAETADLHQGRAIPRQPSHPTADVARAYDEQAQFIGIVVARDDAWQPKKIFHSEI